MTAHPCPVPGCGRPATHMVILDSTDLPLNWVRGATVCPEHATEPVARWLSAGLARSAEGAHDG